jgi:H+/Cl- antiporter ClcA
MAHTEDRQVFFRAAILLVILGIVLFGVEKYLYSGATFEQLMIAPSICFVFAIIAFFVGLLR